MPSKFILHGGSPFALSCKSDFDFFRDLVAPFNYRHIQVLNIEYACQPLDVDPDTLDEMGRREADQLRRTLEWINPHKRFTVWSAPVGENDPGRKKVRGMIELAQIIFVGGGNGDLLQQRLIEVVGTLARFVYDDKVLAGNSAGANMWATQYYSNDNQAVCMGLALLPVKTFCHYSSWKWNKMNELIAAEPQMPVITIADEAYVTLEYGGKIAQQEE